MSGPDTVKILFALSLPCTCMLLYWCRGQIVYETKMESMMTLSPVVWLLHVFLVLQLLLLLLQLLHVYVS